MVDFNYILSCNIIILHKQDPQTESIISRQELLSGINRNYVALAWNISLLVARFFYTCIGRKTHKSPNLHRSDHCSLLVSVTMNGLVAVLSLQKIWSHTHTLFLRTVSAMCDRLCGLVVGVLGYRSGGPGSIPGTTRKKSNGSGTGSTQPRGYNWGATC
jgi:hypothetical protein